MTYLTVSGDTWDMISYKVYGNGVYMNLLLDANPDHIETVIFTSGVTLVVPDLPLESAINLPPWKQGG